MRIDRREFFIHMVQFILFVLLVGLSALGIWPLQREFNHRMTALKNELIVYIEAQLGRTIHYSSISPSIFRYLEIRDLRIMEDTNEELLEIHRVRVYYNILGLLSDDPTRAFFRFSIENSEFVINTRTDADILALLREFIIGGEIFGNPFAQDLEVSGKNLSLVLIGEMGRLSISRLFFEVKSVDRTFDLQLRGRTRFEAMENDLGLRSIQGSLGLEGLLDHDFLRGDFQMNYRDISSNLVSMNDVTLQVAYAEQQVLIRKMQDDVPVDLTIRLGTDTNVLTVDAQSKEFIPADFMTLEEGWKRFAPWMNTVITGRGSLSVSFPEKTTEYRTTVSIRADNSDLPFPVELVADLAGDSSIINVSAMHIDTRIGYATYSGYIDINELMPVGTLGLTDVRYQGFSVNGSLRISEQDEEERVSISSDQLTVNGISVSRFESTMEILDDSVEFALDFSLEEGDAGNQLTAEGIVDLVSGGLSQIAVSIQELPLRPFQEAFGLELPVPLLDDLYQLTGDISATSDFERFSFASRELVIRSKSNPSRYLSLSVIGNNTAVSVQGLTLNWDEYQVLGSVVANIDQEGLFEFSFNLDIQDLPFVGVGYYIPGEGLSVSGNYDLSLSALHVGSGYRFSGVFYDFPLPVADTVAPVSLQVQGHYSSRNDWNVSLQDATVVDFPFGEEFIDVRLSGSLDDSGGTLQRIEISDSISQLSGTAVIDEFDIQNRTTRGWLRLSNRQNDEWYECSFDYAAKAIEGTLAFQGARLRRIPDSPITGGLDGTAQITGSLPSPSVRLEFETRDTKFNLDPIAASGRIEFVDATISIDDFNVEYITNSLENGTGFIDTRAGTIEYATQYRGVFLEDPVAALVSFSGRSAVENSLENLQALITGDAFGTLAVSRIRVGAEEYPDWDVSVERTDRIVVFRGGPEEAITGELNETMGKFSVVVRKPIPVQFRGDGEIRGGIIDARIEDVEFDFNFLATYTQIPYFHPFEGSATGDLSIHGQLSDPDYYGLIRTSGVRATVDVVPEPLGPFDADIVFTGKSFEMRDVMHDIGENEAKIDAFFTIEHWIPVDFEIRIRTTQSEGVHVVYSIAGIDIDGFAIGDFTVSGDQYQTTLEGDLSVHSCLITLSEAPPLPEPEPVETIVDLGITIGRMVEFLWPSRAIPIVRTNAETGGKIDIQYRSGNEELKIMGEVEVKGGTIYYFQRSFFVKGGKLVLNENENEFDPVISARAELREIGPEGQPVRIYLILDEKPFSQFSPRFESEPAMSNVEIASLLGQKVFTQVGSARVDLTSALLLTSDILSQFSVVRTFEDRIKDLFHLDLFSFRTQILQNVIIDRLMNPDTGSQGGIGRYLDNTTLFLGKYFGNDIFLEAMIRLRSDDVSAEDLNTAGNLYVESELSFEWKTPLFLLDFSLMPDFTDLFSTGTTASLGLSWGFSF